MKFLRQKLRRKTLKVIGRVDGILELYWLDLVIDSSQRSNNQSLFVVHSSDDIDLTLRLHFDLLKRNDDLSAIQREKQIQVKLAKVNMNKLFKIRSVRARHDGIFLDREGKAIMMDKLAILVQEYAIKHSYKLVFDSSAESSYYGQVLLFSYKVEDITDKIRIEVRE